MARKPERWITQSYIKFPDGTEHQIREDVFHLTKQQDGSWESELIGSRIIMTENDQKIAFNKMMERTGEVISNYVSLHPESDLPIGKCNVMDILQS